jgi:hypothetical protein
MCDFKIDQQVNLTGRVFCKACGQVAAQGGTAATFAGHEGGFDVFRLIEPLICPRCEAVNKAAEQPCADPIATDVAAQPSIGSRQTDRATVVSELN